MRIQKSERILNIYYSLISGIVVRKTKAAIAYDVDERTIQRDINDIRMFFANKMAIFNMRVVHNLKKIKIRCLCVLIVGIGGFIKFFTEHFTK